MRNSWDVDCRDQRQCRCEHGERTHCDKECGLRLMRLSVKMTGDVPTPRNDVFALNIRVAGLMLPRSVAETTCRAERRDGSTEHIVLHIVAMDLFMCLNRTYHTRRHEQCELPHRAGVKQPKARCVSAKEYQATGHPDKQGRRQMPRVAHMIARLQ